MADAFSQKSLHMSTMMVRELEVIEQLRDMSLICEMTLQSMMLAMLKINNDFLNDIKESQKLYMRLVDLMVGSKQTESTNFKVDEQGVLRFRDIIYVPNEVELKKMILEEIHRSSLSIHPGATKMYQDLKKIFWWSAMKQDVAQFVYACLTGQKSKVEHQKPVGLMQPLDIPEWKWDSISIDFVRGCRIL